MEASAKREIEETLERDPSDCGILYILLPINGMVLPGRAQASVSRSTESADCLQLVQILSAKF